jgi:hypothetical protein
MEEEDDIQEVMPVKAEPRDPVPQNTAVAAVDTSSYRDAAGADQSGGGGQLALDETYQDDGNYDYGDYGEGYEDSSGIIGMAPWIIIIRIGNNSNCCESFPVRLSSAVDPGSGAYFDP